VQDRYRGFQLLGDVQKTESVSRVGVQHHVQIDLPYSLRMPNEEGVLV